LITKDRVTKTNLNEPKNEAGKLLKTGTCGKNEPENEPGHLVEIIRCQRSGLAFLFCSAGLQPGRFIRHDMCLFAQGPKSSNAERTVSTQKIPQAISVSYVA
jgi:hypothetical protein